MARFELFRHSSATNVGFGIPDEALIARVGHSLRAGEFFRIGAFGNERTQNAFDSLPPSYGHLAIQMNSGEAAYCNGEAGYTPCGTLFSLLGLADPERHGADRSDTRFVFTSEKIGRPILVEAIRLSPSRAATVAVGERITLDRNDCIEILIETLRRMGRAIVNPTNGERTDVPMLKPLDTILTTFDPHPGRTAA